MADIPSKAALIVVDVQEDFCEPNGSLAVKGGRELASRINQLLDMPGFALRLACRDYHPRNHVSFASRHTEAIPFKSETTIHNPKNLAETQTTTLWPDHCVQGTPGCEIIPEIAIEKFDAVVNKGVDVQFESYSGFGPPFRNPAVAMTELNHLLESAEVTHVFCAGLSYNVCVFFTAVDAAEHGYKTFVIKDATASRQSEEGLLATRMALEAKGVAVVDSDSEALNIARSH